MDDRRLLFGTAGWSYPDWKGRFYPAPRPRGFDELAFLARHLDAVEVNSTFYRPPERRHVASWIERTARAPGFLFSMKLHRSFTHGEAGAFAAGPEAAAFLRALEPALEAGRLGALLAQFPWHFDNTAEHRRRLAGLARFFPGAPLAVELRHASWDLPAAWDFLDDLGLALCNIDQPRSCGSLGLTDLLTERLGYFRFHGRNRDAWFDRDAGRDEKYDYLYSADELASFLPLLRGAADRARTTFVIGNNHYKGQAPANMLQLKALLTGRPVDVPAPLLEAFPFLAEAAGEAP